MLPILEQSGDLVIMEVRNGMRKEHFRRSRHEFGCQEPWVGYPRHWYPRRRKFLTNVEKKARLEKYKEFLEKELAGVKERLAELQKEPEKVPDTNQA